MNNRFQSVTLSDWRSVAEQILDARGGSPDYLGAEHFPGALSATGLQSVSADVIVVMNPANPARRERLRKVLPGHLGLIAATPDHDLAMAVSTARLRANAPLVNEAQSFCELVVRIAAATTVAFVNPDAATQWPPVTVPELTMPKSGPGASWLRGLLQDLPLPGTSTQQVVLRAGLFLLNDFFDESHECSQSIEGLGEHHSGDYWHAILHRREPDYGNAKYWFRHVGRHPVFAELADAVASRLSTGPVPEGLQRWSDKLVKLGNWDPFAFVDLCEAASGHKLMREWCAQVQFDEMLLLLEATCREANRHSSD